MVKKDYRGVYKNITKSKEFHEAYDGMSATVDDTQDDITSISCIKQRLRVLREHLIDAVEVFSFNHSYYHPSTSVWVTFEKPDGCLTVNIDRVCRIRPLDSYNEEVYLSTELNNYNLRNYADALSTEDLIKIADWLGIE